MLRAPTIRQLLGFLLITRPMVSIVAAAYSLLGAYLGGSLSLLPLPTVLRAALVVGLVVSYSFAINDYRDVASDRLNHPERPIPSGRITRPAAGILSLTLALIALSVTLTLGPWLTVLALFNIFLSTLYSYYLKNTVLIGNCVIAFLNASIVVYGGLAVGHVIPAIWIISLLIFLFTLAQEILFAIGDLEGDALAGVRTTATSLGVANSLHLFHLIVLSFVVFTLVVWFLGLVPDRFLYAVVLCSFLPLVGIIILLRRATQSNIHLAIQVIKFVRFFCLLPGILLK